MHEQNKMTFTYATERITRKLERDEGGPQSLDLVSNVLNSCGTEDYHVYEQDKCWHIGLSRQSSLTIDSSGSFFEITTEQGKQCNPIASSLKQILRTFVSKYATSEMKIFGFVGYNYAAHSRDLPYVPGTWPLVSLMVYRYQITIEEDGIIFRGPDDAQFQRLLDSVMTITRKPQLTKKTSVDILEGAINYVNLVQKAISRIKDGHLAKIIASRAVPIKEPVDMPATLALGRKANTPRRSFCLKHWGYQATGFSPELVFSIRDGRLETEPLAGTRAFPEDYAKQQELRNELLNDPKEVLEHVVSVREAIGELQVLCSPGSVVVEDFMSVRIRGQVQHLGSRVAGNLDPEADGWDALDLLFPSITASGIPKHEALKEIESLESAPRELYSGGVLLIDEQRNAFECALVLRSVFQDPGRRWVQAGAGVLALSDPQRELTETCEKLATIAPFVVANH